MARYSVEPAKHPLDFCDPDPSTNPTKPLEHFLKFDPQEGSLKIDWDYSTSGTPMDVYHGRILRFAISARVNAVNLTEAINAGEFDALLDTIQQGHTVSWDGHNHKGYLSAEAEDAEETLRRKIEDYEDDQLGGLWDAGDWLYETRHELGIAATSTDAELKALAAQLEAEALNENAKLYGTEEYLQSIRREIIDAAEDEES